MSDHKPHIEEYATKFIVTLPTGGYKPNSPGELDEILDRLREWLLERYV